MTYIKTPFITDPETLSHAVFDYITSRVPTWVPQEGNLDVWIIRAVAALAAENRDIASDVQDDIFRYYGSSLVGVPPLDSTPAQGNTTWTLINTAGHTIPAGTVVGIRDSLGNLQSFQTVSDVIVPVGNSATAAGEVVISAIQAGSDASGIGTPAGSVELIDIIDWVASITLVAATTGGIDAESDADYLSRLALRMQRLSQRPILPADFAAMALDADSTVYRAIAIDGYIPSPNLLTANEASAETDAAGWTSLANTTLTSTSAQAADGTKSLSMQAASSADMSIVTVAAKVCTPGQNLTAVASYRTAVTGRVCKVGLQFRDAAHAQIGSIFYGTTINDLTTGWTQASVSAVAPANTIEVRVVTFVTAPANAEVHYVDKIGLIYGFSTTWAAGGTAALNNQERAVAVAAIKSDGTPVSATVSAAIDSLLQANREINFIVNVTQPNYTVITVAVTVVILQGYAGSAVDAAITAAITSYLNPANWGKDPTILEASSSVSWVETSTVYYNEMITEISNVQGVDRVTVLTINGGTANVSLATPAALTTPGTITITHA